MSKKYTIDEIFRQGQNLSPEEMRPELWNKLDRRLSDIRPPKRGLRMWLTAASILLLASMLTLLNINSDTYQVEDLLIEDQPYFSKEEIEGLDAVYIAENRPMLNRNFG